MNQDYLFYVDLFEVIYLFAREFGVSSPSARATPHVFLSPLVSLFPIRREFFISFVRGPLKQPSPFRHVILPSSIVQLYFQMGCSTTSHMLSLTFLVPSSHFLVFLSVIAILQIILLLHPLSKARESSAPFVCTKNELLRGHDYPTELNGIDQLTLPLHVCHEITSHIMRGSLP